MKRIIFFAVIVSCINASSYGQGMAINAAGTPADASAMLDISSDSKGILVPRMDSAHRAGIATPATGLMVYQTDGASPGFYYYSGSSWSTFGAPANATTQGNVFNNPNQLVQLDSNGALPAVSARNVTHINGSNIDTGTINVNRISTGGFQNFFTPFSLLYFYSDPNIRYIIFDWFGTPSFGPNDLFLPVAAGFPTGSIIRFSNVDFVGSTPTITIHSEGVDFISQTSVQSISFSFITDGVSNWYYFP